MKTEYIVITLILFVIFLVMGVSHLSIISLSKQIETVSNQLTFPIVQSDENTGVDEVIYVPLYKVFEQLLSYDIAIYKNQVTINDILASSTDK